MTPEQAQPVDVWAQDLLVGTNNGPWECGPDETAWSVWTKDRHTPIATDVDPGDAELICAVHELVATVIELFEKNKELEDQIAYLEDQNDRLENDLIAVMKQRNVFRKELHNRKEQA